MKTQYKTTKQYLEITTEADNTLYIYLGQLDGYIRDGVDVVDDKLQDKLNTLVHTKHLLRYDIAIDDNSILFNVRDSEGTSISINKKEFIELVPLGDFTIEQMGYCEDSKRCECEQNIEDEDFYESVITKVLKTIDRDNGRTTTIKQRVS